jgi:hypothetical protein
MLYKSLIIPLAIAGGFISTTANAWWGGLLDDDDSESKWNSSTYGEVYNSSTGKFETNGWGDSSADAEMEGDIEFTFKARSRARNKTNTRGSANGNSDSQYRGYVDNYWNSNNGYYTRSYQSAPQFPPVANKKAKQAEKAKAITQKDPFARQKEMSDEMKKQHEAAVKAARKAYEDRMRQWAVEMQNLE